MSSRQRSLPKLMRSSISDIDHADYLAPQHKGKILYNNTARFYLGTNHKQNSGSRQG